jgi:hypothetical protein
MRTYFLGMLHILSLLPVGVITHRVPTWRQQTPRKRRVGTCRLKGGEGKVPLRRGYVSELLQ